LDNNDDPNRPPYVPPPDPFAWPKERDSAQDLVDRKRSQTETGPSGGSATPSPSGSATGGPHVVTSAAPPTSATEQEPVVETQVTIKAVDTDVRRGLPLHIQGEVKASGAACAHTRVDVVLVSGALPQGVTIGALSTDERGGYDGAVVIPQDFAVGDYELFVTTPGDAHCAPTGARTAPPDVAR
jgi:hypothetical protein